MLETDTQLPPRKTPGNGEMSDALEPEGRHLEDREKPTNPPDGETGESSVESPCENERREQTG